MTKKNIEKINKFLFSLDIDTYVLEAIDIEKINLKKGFDGILEQILNCDENFEIIGHQKAIDYLKENDASLIKSIEIAIEYGYSIKNLTSEILASLLYKNLKIEKLFTLQNKINEFFKNLKE